jgi:hypothetical protein
VSAIIEQGAGKPATMESLRRQIQSPETNMPIVRMGFGDLQGFELMQRAAKALAASTLVPVQFQNNMPNCLIALEMAHRIGASPLMVMQNLYIVHGRPGWSAKFLIATFNQCGRFSSVRYNWESQSGKDEWGCQAYAKEKDNGELIKGPSISIALAKKEGWYDKSGSKWKTIPELMLMYRAAAWMINTHAPEISMGLNTAEELSDVYDAAPGADGKFQVTTDSLRAINTDTGEIGEQPDAQSTGQQDRPIIQTTTQPITGDSLFGDQPTAIDAIAAFAGIGDIDKLDTYMDSLPESVKTDARVTKAFKERRDALKDATGGKKK